MSLREQLNSPDYFTQEKSAFQARNVELISARESPTTPMIGIYLVEEGRFSYFNEGFKKLLGENNDPLIKRGWAFWFELVHPKNVAYIRNQISKFFSHPYKQNLLTLNYFINILGGKQIPMKHEIIMHRFDRQMIAINFFQDDGENEKTDYFFQAKSTFKSFRPQREEDLHLSPREKEVLHLIANGFSSKQIADMLFISGHTAISHRKNLIEKFHVKNTAHLIKKASELIPSF